MKNKLLCVLFSLCLSFQCLFIPASAADTEPATRISAGSEAASQYNVVFVVDGSGSMEASDVSAQRIDAIRLFLSLSTEWTNYAGALVFNGDIAMEVPLSECIGASGKKALADEIEAVEVGGYTDIGGALLRAADMLNNDRNPDLPSVIILLTDGNTELETAAEESTSLEKKEEAIRLCKAIDCKIYCVMLNADGNANLSELSEISEKTDGVALEVASADDLPGIYENFYSLIYGTDRQTLLSEDVIAGEIVCSDFEIPSLGVAEANILLSGDASLTDLTLTSPSGDVYTQADLGEYYTQCESFSSIKLLEPEAGTWILSAVADEPGQVIASLVLNRNITINAELIAETISLINDVVTLTMSLAVNGETLYDLSEYADYEAFADIVCDGETTTYQLTASGAVYTADIPVTGYGSYQVIPYLAENTTMLVGSTLSGLVVNREPKLTAAAGKTVFCLSGTIFGLKKTVALDRMSEDPDGEALVYIVSASDYKADNAYIDGNTLLLKNRGLFAIHKVSITATDPAGASVVWDTKIVSVGIPLILLLLVILTVLVEVKVYRSAFSGHIDARILLREEDNGTELGHCVIKDEPGPLSYGYLDWNGGGHLLRSSALIFKHPKKGLFLIPRQPVRVGSRQFSSFSHVPISMLGETRVCPDKTESGRVIVFMVDTDWTAGAKKPKAVSWRF